MKKVKKKNGNRMECLIEFSSRRKKIQLEKWTFLKCHTMISLYCKFIIFIIILFSVVSWIFSYLVFSFLNFAIGRGGGEWTNEIFCIPCKSNNILHQLNVRYAYGFVISIIKYFLCCCCRCRSLLHPTFTNISNVSEATTIIWVSTTAKKSHQIAILCWILMTFRFCECGWRRIHLLSFSNINIIMR